MTESSDLNHARGKGKGFEEKVKFLRLFKTWSQKKPLPKRKWLKSEF